MYIRLIVILALSWHSIAYAQEATTFALGPEGQVVEARFQVWKPSNPRAVIVINPSFGDNPVESDALELDEWKQFAFNQHVGLMLVDFDISGALGQPKGENLNPIMGVSEVVQKAVAQEFKGDCPIFIYGRNDASTRFILSMMDANPDKYLGWCNNGVDFFQYLPHLKKQTPPGILACTTDTIRYDDAQSFFSSGRVLKNKWTWVSYHAIDEPQLRTFARNYCLALLESPSDQWRNIKSHDSVDGSTADSDPENTTWLPTAAIADQWANLEVLRAAKTIIVEREIDLSGHNLPNIQLYLKIPKGAEDASGVDGVMAYCTWARERDNLIQQLSNDPDQPAEKVELPSVQMLHYADKHNLAVLTWSTPGKWNVDENGDKLTTKERLDMDREFDIFTAAWDQGVTKLAHDYKLPEDKYLLFGMSRGAQWAHRLALRNPKRFLAVNVHVSSSYEEPTEGAKSCLWLITSGQFDSGLEDSKKFYASCQKLGFPILFKAPDGLGHSMRSDVDVVRNAFFDYALSLKAQAQNSDLDASNAISSQNAKFIGNLDSQEVVASDKADQIKEENRVYLPTDLLAEAWKTPTPPLVGPSKTKFDAAQVDSSPPTSKPPVNLDSTNSLLPITNSQASSTNVVETSKVSVETPTFHTATVNVASKIEATTSTGGHAAVPVDPGTKLKVISVNADGTVTVVNEFHFQGTISRSSVSLE